MCTILGIALRMYSSRHAMRADVVSFVVLQSCWSYPEVHSTINSGLIPSSMNQLMILNISYYDEVRSACLRAGRVGSKGDDQVATKQEAGIGDQMRA